MVSSAIIIEKLKVKVVLTLQQWLASPFKIILSLFGWKENILYKQHIVQCTSLIKSQLLELVLL